MNIVLTGFMASGKTTVGGLLSKFLGYEFIDTDAEIEKCCGKTVAEIFELFGEDYFRHMESVVAEEVSNLDNTVIATGGGLVLNTKSVGLLRKNGVIVNLEPAEELIKSRLMRDKTRPLSGGDIIGRFKQRQPYYDNCDLKIKVNNKTSKEVAKEIIRKLEEKYEGKIRSGR